MPCLACLSGNQAEFTAEINIHLRGRENINNPGVLVFPKLRVCLDCGSSHFSTPQAELSQLVRLPPTHAVNQKGNVDAAVGRRRIVLGA
jgi:hypothetical protein